MCGIAGIFNIKADSNLNLPIHAMTDALAHRGPDSGGFYVEKNKIALGHRRLSIIDLSTSANQPFKDDLERYTLIFNGEIYNYQDIKPLIQGYRFKTTSDTEVILAAYIKWGKDCLQYLNGMFAFAIWDKIDQTLFIARDRLGIKPLYYYLDNERFIFSSEIRSMLQSGFIPRQLDKNALRDYLVFQSVYAPSTMVKNVHQLMPGAYAFISNEGMKKSFYWKIETPKHPDDSNVLDAQTAQKNVKDLLSNSVARRMISDVPLGAFLSGGIDSSAIVALMAQASERPIDTFTVSFQEKQFDESHFANVIAKKYNTNHTKIDLSPNDFLKELPQALDAMDAPSGDGLNTYVVSKATKKAGVTVALSGLGSDELFAGYPYARHFQQLNTTFPNYWRIPTGLRNPILSLAHSALSSNDKMGRAIDMLAVDAPTIDAIYPTLRGVNTEGVVQNFLNFNENKRALTIQKLLKERQNNLSELPLLSQMTVAEMLGYTLNVLVKDTDQFSMASALEVREPFFDYKLVEYVLTIPDELKYSKTTPKNLLVGALGSLLPHENVHRPKMGFSFPWRHWLLNELRPFCEKYLQNLAQYDFLNHPAIQAEWTLFRSKKGEKQSYVKIWQWVVLSYWLKKNGIQ
jgi:asparagine synthase (glutamine-hydrolysing)